MNAKIFRNNLAVLKKRYPNLAYKIEKTIVPPELKLVKTNSRWPTIALEICGRYFFFHSKDNPKKEAISQAEKFVLNEVANIIALGFGLGYHIEQFLKKIHRESYLIIVEQHLPIFKVALGIWDMREIFSNRRVLLFVDERPEDIFESLKKIIFPLANNPFTILYHDTSMLLFRDYYLQVERKVKEVIIWGRKNLEAGIRFRRNYQRNIIRNLKYFLFSPGISHIDLSNVLPIICAAGPSLERAIPFLRKCKGYAVIIAVDTALKPLLERNISPDIVISIDPTQVNYLHFVGVEDNLVSDIPLVIDPQVFYKIPQDYPGLVLCPRLLNSAIVDLFSDLVKEKGIIDKGMSVAHTALSVISRLGARDVVFCGLDLSFLPDKSHIDGVATFTTDLSDRRNIKVDGRDGIVFTDEVFFAYIKHFEGMISSMGINFWNMSWGAKIKGAKFVDEDDVWKLIKNVGYRRDSSFSVMPKDIFCVDKGVVKKRVGEWIKQTKEIMGIAKEVVDSNSLDDMRVAFSKIKRYGVVSAILEETMEEVAVILSSRELWEGKDLVDKFRLYFKNVIGVAEFILEEVRNANIY